MLAGHTDHHTLKHARMLHDNLLDLIRVNIETRHENHVFLAIDDAHTALRAHDADIARLEIAVRRKRRLGLVRQLPVALHYLRPTYRHLAWIAQRYFVVVAIQ